MVVVEPSGLVVDVVDDEVVDDVVDVDVEVVGGTSHPETQNTLNLVSAPIDPSAWTVSLTCQPCCGCGSMPAAVGQVVGLGGVEAGLAAAARVVVLADEHRVGEKRLDLARRRDGPKVTSAYRSPSSKP